MNRKLELFLTFLKIGAFTFGGGYVMLPLIQHEMVHKKKWLDEDEMVDMIAISESTPGPLAINSATFVGYRTGKYWGSFFATLGVVLPSFFIVLLISLFFRNFLEIKIIADAFRGIRAGVTVLILNASLKIFKKSPKTFIGYILIALALGLSLFVEFRFLSMALIVFGFLVGFLIQIFKKVPEQEI